MPRCLSIIFIKSVTFANNWYIPACFWQIYFHGCIQQHVWNNIFITYSLIQPFIYFYMIFAYSLKGFSTNSMWMKFLLVKWLEFLISHFVMQIFKKELAKIKFWCFWHDLRIIRCNCKLWDAHWFYCVFGYFHTLFMLKYCIFTKLSQIVCPINVKISICQHAKCDCRLWKVLYLFFVFFWELFIYYYTFETI